MEERCYHPLPEIQEITTTLSAGVTRSIRDVLPADYTLKIKSFSLLLNVFSDRAVEQYTSACFESGGYKWRLALYPNGDQKRDGNGHVSLYLQLAEAETLPAGLEVYVNFKLFIHDQIRDKYLTVQDADARVRRFHRMKHEHGFPQLISLAIFNDASNGYLVDDSCVFGAEIFVIKNKSKAECLTMMRELASCNHICRIDNFSKLDKEEYLSSPFIAAGRKWRLALGQNRQKNGISFYLLLADYAKSPKYLDLFGRRDSTTLPQEWKVYVECTLCIKDQMHGRNVERKFNHWFSFGSPPVGYADFISLEDLKDHNKGFLKNDTLIIQATFGVNYAAQNLS